MKGNHAPKCSNDTCNTHRIFGSSLCLRHTSDQKKTQEKQAKLEAKLSSKSPKKMRNPDDISTDDIQELKDKLLQIEESFHSRKRKLSDMQELMDKCRELEAENNELKRIHMLAMELSN